MVPTLGESVTEATVATWFKKEGETVEVDEMLCELETDKVAIEVPSTASGKLVEIIAAEGSVVALNGVLAKIDSDETSHSKGSDEIKKSKGESETNNETNKDIEHSPSAKKMMVENNITSNDLIGSGKQGRILKEDVKNYLNHQGNIAPEDNYEKEPKINYPIESQDRSLEEVKRMSRLRQTIAERLKSAQNTAAILTTYNEIDMTEVIKMRKTYKDEFEVKHSVKLGFMSFFIKACCHALLEIPEVNAEISRENQETIYIYSKTANYNKINNNTIFKEKVSVKYGYQTIDSEVLNLNFKDNLIEILDNVYYVSKDTRIKADKVEIDLLYKNLKISMINKKDKVHITSKY